MRREDLQTLIARIRESGMEEVEYHLKMWKVPGFGSPVLLGKPVAPPSLKDELAFTFNHLVQNVPTFASLLRIPVSDRAKGTLVLNLKGEEVRFVLREGLPATQDFVEEMRMEDFSEVVESPGFLDDTGEFPLRLSVRLDERGEEPRGEIAYGALPLERPAFWELLTRLGDRISKEVTDRWKRRIPSEPPPFEGEDLNVSWLYEGELVLKAWTPLPDGGIRLEVERMEGSVSGVVSYREYQAVKEVSLSLSQLYRELTALEIDLL